MLLSGLLFALSITPCTLQAQLLDGGGGGLIAPPTPRPRVFTIRDIRVTGAVNTSASAVIAFSGLRIGDSFVPGSEIFAEAVRNLYQRKVFSNVRIFAAEPKDTTLVIVIDVVEFPRVASIRVEGNDEIDEDDLIEEMLVTTGDIANPYELNRSERKIKAKYAEEGYLFSNVKIERRPSAEEGRVDVVVIVDEGPEVSIGEITIEGNSLLDDDDLKGAMKDVKQKSWWQFWRSSKLQKEKLKDDEKRIVDLYRSKGYIEADVVGDTIVINPATGKSDITITVSEGKQVYLRSLRISGNSEYDSLLIRSLIGIDENKPYDQLALEENLNGPGELSVRSWYLDHGYLTFTAAISEQRVGPDSLDVVVRITEGVPAYIRYIDIAGNTKTKDKVIRRELYTVPGDRFSRAAIIRSLRNLANLNYFNPEALVPDVRPSADATSVDIVYEVEERPSDTFNASMGLSSQGITGSIGLSFTNFSLEEPLSGGGGQILNLNAEFGSFVQTYSLGVSEPWLFGKPITLGGNVFYQKTDLSLADNNEQQLERIGVSLTSGMRLKWPDDYFRLDGALRFSKNNLLGGATATGTAFRKGTELSLSTTLSRRSIDNTIFPTLGSSFRLPIVFAFGGDAEYIRPELSFEFFSPIAKVGTSNTLVLFLNAETGYLKEISPRSTISPTIFYTMGGTVLSGFNTIQLRGYDDRSVGPVEDAYPSGTTYFKTAAELRFPLTLNPIPIYFLTFAEAGNVWGDLGDYNPFDLRRSAGFGMRVMMPPIGLLGFDYGFGFDTDSRRESATSSGTSSGWHFHFQFGR
ncbi:MAG: outer membrane protein assembly factor BamA [Candidatus Kapaibacterium sp.]